MEGEESSERSGKRGRIGKILERGQRIELYKDESRSRECRSSRILEKFVAAEQCGSRVVAARWGGEGGM